MQDIFQKNVEDSFQNDKHGNGKVECFHHLGKPKIKNLGNFGQSWRRAGKIYMDGKKIKAPIVFPDEMLI